MPAPKSAPLFELIEAGIKEDGKSFVSKVNGVIQFNVGPDAIWTLDLKNGNGSVSQKAAEKADIIINVSDDDFAALAAGSLNPQQAFMQGKIKVKGNMALAMKLNTVLAAARPKSKL